MGFKKGQSVHVIDVQLEAGAASVAYDTVRPNLLLTIHGPSDRRHGTVQTEISPDEALALIAALTDGLAKREGRLL